MASPLSVEATSPCDGNPTLPVCNLTPVFRLESLRAALFIRWPTWLGGRQGSQLQNSGHGSPMRTRLWSTEATSRFCG